MSDDGHDSSRPGRSGLSADDQEPAAELDQDTYNDMLVLERLESLEEEMEDLGVTTLEQLRQRIEELHRRLDEQE